MGARRIGGMIAAMILAAGCQQVPQAEFTPLEPIPPKLSGEETLAQARQYLRLGDEGQAERYFISSINRGGPSAEALSGLGLIAERQGLLAQATTYFEMALRLAPNSVVAHNNLGAVHYKRRRYHEARQSFRAAFALSSGESDIAKHNLRLADAAVAEVDTALTDIAYGHRVLRIGVHEYILAPKPAMAAHLGVELAPIEEEVLDFAEVEAAQRPATDPSL
ncbi:MAG: tetratricopeptide repeat protein [Pseudomonadota bacterium]